MDAAMPSVNFGKLWFIVSAWHWSGAWTRCTRSAEHFEPIELIAFFKTFTGNWAGVERVRHQCRSSMLRNCKKNTHELHIMKKVAFIAACLFIAIFCLAWVMACDCVHLLVGFFRVFFVAFDYHLGLISLRYFHVDVFRFLMTGLLFSRRRQRLWINSVHTTGVIPDECRT